MADPEGPEESVRIRRVRESDLLAFRELRLRALAADPMAFGSTYHRESEYEHARWDDLVRRGAESPTEATWVSEFKDGSFVGMIGAFHAEQVFHVWGMWVDPEYRGRGVGGRLLDALLAWVRTADLFAEVRLSVAPTQVPALRLYRSRGFTPTGTVELLEHTPGAVACEMVLRSYRSSMPGAP
jgi:ribosomal protein S18 acetylase RimI-like enzyme